MIHAARLSRDESKQRYDDELDDDTSGRTLPTTSSRQSELVVDIFSTCDALEISMKAKLSRLSDRYSYTFYFSSRRTVIIKENEEHMLVDLVSYFSELHVLRVV